MATIYKLDPRNFQIKGFELVECKPVFEDDRFIDKLTYVTKFGTVMIVKYDNNGNFMIQNEGEASFGICSSLDLLVESLRLQKDEIIEHHKHTYGEVTQQ